MIRVRGVHAEPTRDGEDARGKKTRPCEYTPVGCVGGIGGGSKGCDKTIPAVKKEKGMPTHILKKGLCCCFSSSAFFRTVEGLPLHTHTLFF